MLKALLKKQLSETFVFLFKGKNGKMRSGGALAVYSLLMVYVLIVLLAAFFMMGKALCEPLLSIGLGWLYFAIMGITATVLGVIGSVFTTYSGLYEAKDNNLLLSMPIPPAAILFSRIISIYTLIIIFESAVMLPAGVVYWLCAGLTAPSVIIFILTLFILPLLALALCCILGWLIALIASRLRKKNFIVLVLSLAFLGAYFFFYSKINTYLQLIIANSQLIADSVQAYLYPIYHMGLGLEGHFLSFAVFALILIAIFAVIYLILSRSFIRLTTDVHGRKGKKYVKREMRVQSAGRALLSKEFSRYLSSPNYMLNASLGSLLLIVGTVAIIIYRPRLLAFLQQFPNFKSYIAGIAIAALSLLTSMNFITAPSVSLEGKSIWLPQTMPIKPWLPLFAKIKLHLILTYIPCIVCAVAVAAVLNTGVLDTMFILIVPLLFALFTGLLGLLLNLKMPNLTWTNEALVVKQSGSVTVSMFAGWGSLLLFVAAYFLLRSVIPQFLLFAGFCILLIAANILVIKWLKTKGSEIFAHL